MDEWIIIINIISSSSYYYYYYSTVVWKEGNLKTDGELWKMFSSDVTLNKFPKAYYP